MGRDGADLVPAKSKRLERDLSRDRLHFGSLRTGSSENSSGHETRIQRDLN